MRNKKFIALVVVLMLAVSLFSACGKKKTTDDGADTTNKTTNNNSDNKTDDNEKEEETWKKWEGTITVWDGPRWTDEEENQYHWLEAKKAEFEATYPGVSVEIVKVPWAEMGEKLSVAVAGRAWPDVTAVDISKGGVDRNLVKQGVIEPVNEFFTDEEMKDFYQSALSAYEVEGNLFGIPNSMSVHAMLLNLDIFEAKGVEPPQNGKWTYDEFVEKMKALTGDGVYGFSTYILNGYYESWPFILMDGAYPLSSDYSKYTFDSEQAISGLQKLLDLKFKHKVTPQEMGGGDVGGTWKAWASEEQRTVAVEPWATWAIAAAQGEKWKTNLMVAEYPIGETGKSATISGVGGWVMFKQKDADKKRMTAEFMKYMSSTDEQLAMAQNYGVFPARMSTVQLNPYADNPVMAAAQKLTENAVMVPAHPSWARIDEAIQRELQLAGNGEKTAEEALKAARSSVEAILSE